MFFTREDILKIQQALLQLGVKDSELPSAEPVTYDDTLSIIQDGKNRQIGVKDFFNQISLWKREDFLNITDRYDEHYIMLLEAINLVPILQRKDGLVITFQDTNGDWRIYQFRGNITEFLDEEKWFDLYDYKNYIIKSFLPDEEDITALTPDENGNSFLALKDRIYDPTIFSGKGYKFVRKNIINIELAVTKISVINSTTLTGNIYFKINNKGVNISLDALTHNTTRKVAEAIKDTLAINCNDYKVTVTDSVVTLTRRYSGSISPTTFEMYNTGVRVIVEDTTTIDKRNVITQEDINKTDTIYEIRYDFDLDGKTITIPKNCILYFTSGKFYNGSINMNNTIVSTFSEDILLEVNIRGNYYNIQKSIKDANNLIQGNTNKLNNAEKNIEHLDARSSQMEETIKGIVVTGGASKASAVTYENTNSGLNSINAQGAIDELADKMFNKENVAQEFGDSKDKVVSQFALPFREIESPEFIKIIVDANDHLLFTINLDGEVDWGKGIPKPIRAKLQEIINQCQQDKTDILEAINAAKKELSASITALQESKVDKEEGKSLIDDEVKECFRIIENEEFIKAIVDSDDKVLFGFYRATGKPYYPLNEMYHVIQNKEYFAAWLDADDKVVLGIRRDGEIIGKIHAVNALKQVISQLQSNLASLQEKVGAIDTNLKELLDVFSLQENPEYIAVETDAEGKILSSTNADGSHYIHNAKSETIPEEFSHIEDPEGRTEITTDAEDKILGYRDSEGTRHEHKISANHINLSDEAAKEVNEAFKSAGIKMENPSDFSKDSHIELPIPRIAAQVRLYAPKLPTTKQDDIEAEIEYNDKDGNYLRKPVILNAQGSSSMSYYVKNMAIDINDGSEIKFGDFPTQDSFHLKKYYIDAFRGQCIVGYWLMEQVYKSRPIGQQYPYEYSYSNESVTDGYGDVKKDFFNGAKCHPDGFPITITWVNTDTRKETWMGVYTWNLKKSKEVYNCNKKKAENIILDGSLSANSIFSGSINWSAFEIRNPKSLIDIDGNKYDGDNPKELSDTDPTSKKVKDYLVALSGIDNELKANKTKETFEKHFLVAPFIDYYLVSQVIYNLDGFDKNWIWVTYDGTHWTPTLYDVDSIFGMFMSGTFIVNESVSREVGAGNIPANYLKDLYNSEIVERYKELRNLEIFSTENICKLLDKWCNAVGYHNFEEEFKVYDQTPSYRNGNYSQKWRPYSFRGNPSTASDYDAEKQYSKNDYCFLGNLSFIALDSVIGESPVSKEYDKYPEVGGFYNSKHRVYEWLKKRIDYLDSIYK